MYQNYTINQLCLPIDLEIKLEENDFAHAIVQFVDSIPMKSFFLIINLWVDPNIILVCYFPLFFVPIFKGFIRAAKYKIC